jgi:hypothetical protein
MPEWKRGFNGDWRPPPIWKPGNPSEAARLDQLIFHEISSKTRLHAESQQLVERVAFGTVRGLSYPHPRGNLFTMPTCKGCGEEVDELVSVSTGGKKKKLCEQCAEEEEQADDMAQASEAAVQQMMGFKGRR